MTVGEIIRLERTKAKLSQAALGEMVNVSQQAVGKWEKGRAEPDATTLLSLSRIFKVSTDYLLGKEKDGNTPAIPNEVELNDLYPVPLLGSVVAGVPIEAQENLEGYIYISYRPCEEYFALRVHGDSMKNAGIFDKSVVVCHKQENADSGEIVVAMLNGEQTVKRLKIVGSNVILMPENPEFDPIFVSEKDELIILGKVVEVRMQI